MNHHDALNKLIEGNRRFVAMQAEFPNRTPDHRFSLLGDQRPFAAILGCSDSRVPVEHIFDQGFGDLFVIRVAGNISNAVVLGSLEFAVSILEVSLIVILGHSQCGAVKATVSDSTPLGYIPEIIERIRPMMLVAQDQPGDFVENVTRANALNVTRQLTRQSGILLDAIKRDEIAIVPMYYDLASGVVDLLTNE